MVITNCIFSDEFSRIMEYLYVLAIVGLNRGSLAGIPNIYSQPKITRSHEGDAVNIHVHLRFKLFMGVSVIIIIYIPEVGINVCYRFMYLSLKLYHIKCLKAAH